MTLHPEVMADTQARLLRRVAAAVGERAFYLAGGTGVALHLGHRTSVDLDWFTSRRLGDPLRLLEILRDAGLQPGHAVTDEGTLHVSIEGVRTTFLEYRYPLLADPVESAELGCRLASLEDLACIKLSAIAGRGARRDFIDVHAIVRSGIPLDRLLDLYARKFDLRERGHLLRGLVYFADAEEEAMPTMLRDTTWEAICRDLERWVKAVVDES